MLSHFSSDDVLFCRKKLLTGEFPDLEIKNLFGEQMGVNTNIKDSIHRTFSSVANVNVTCDKMHFCEYTMMYYSWLIDGKYKLCQFEVIRCNSASHFYKNCLQWSYIVHTTTYICIYVEREVSTRQYCIHITSCSPNASLHYRVLSFMHS